jgi:hypothetical protein
MKTHSHLFGRIVAAGLVLAASAAHSQAQTPVEGGYPEFAPRAILVAIIKGMNAAIDGTVPDPRSMSDVILCPPTHIKYSKSDGRPEKWYVAFSMNSRTRDGGYSGRIMYGAVFRRGRLPEVTRTQAKTDEAFDHLFNQMIAKTMKDCPIVPNEQLSALMGASDRPTVDVSH